MKDEHRRELLARRPSSPRRGLHSPTRSSSRSGPARRTRRSRRWPCIRCRWSAPCSAAR